MRFLWVIHLYPPYHNCGAEYMAHCLNKFLISRGHDVRVLLRQAPWNKSKQVYEHEGVLVFPANSKADVLVRNSDVVMTHLDYTHQAINLARMHNRKCIHFVHNSSPYESIKSNEWVNVVYNSKWISQELKYPNKSFVLYPPVDPNHYRVETFREMITMINLDHNKGGHILKQIAERMPDRKFLGVIGSYSSDASGQYINQPPNVELTANTSNILDVYKRTRILIMPSLYESWGRTATEAMCSGIPVVASATRGLIENCDFAGLYVHDRDDIDQWVRWIKRLDGKKFYEEAAKKAVKRSLELDPKKQMEDFLAWI